MSVGGREKLNLDTKYGCVLSVWYFSAKLNVETSGLAVMG